jgi:hypothetical protein
MAGVCLKLTFDLEHKKEAFSSGKILIKLGIINRYKKIQLILRRHLGIRPTSNLSNSTDGTLTAKMK